MKSVNTPLKDDALKATNLQEGTLKTTKKYSRIILEEFLFGLLWFIIFMSIWLFMFKPYKDFGHYKADAVQGQNIFVTGSGEAKIIYEIDGAQYEAIIDFSVDQVKNTTELNFYYQKDNPEYIVFDRNTSLIVVPCISSVGLIVFADGIRRFYKEKKQISF